MAGSPGRKSWPGRPATLAAALESREGLRLMDGGPFAGPMKRGEGTTMRPNRIKQMWREGKCVTLGWLSVSHGFSAEVMARQGFDALCVDLQHGTAEMKDVAPMLQAISQTDTVPVVRVAWNEPAAIMKALDLGAYGIIVPLVNTAEEAEARRRRLPLSAGRHALVRSGARRALWRRRLRRQGQ